MSAYRKCSPERINEKTPLDTPRSAVTDLRKTLRVLERKNAQEMLARKPAPTMYQP